VREDLSAFYTGTARVSSHSVFETGEHRVNSDTGSGNGDQGPPPKQQEPSKHCKRCRAVLGPGATRFGDKPAYDVYVCAACGFIEWVAVL
jgi:DNA-directed RNA polymerase subunit M/transcription elongation factor TFIIS